jgi:hypothetical protein
VLGEKWAAADKSLQEALRLCHPSHAKNRAAILFYLVPVRLLRGVLPSAALLATPTLEVFAPFVAALRAGDVAAFERALAEHQVVLMRVRPVYLGIGVALMALRCRRVATHTGLQSSWHCNHLVASHPVLPRRRRRGCV